MKKCYEDIFFDLDHTLWDFRENSKVTLKELHQITPILSDIPFEEFFEVYYHHNNKLWARYRNGFINSADLRWKRFWHTLLDFNIRDIELSQNIGQTYLALLPVQTKLCDGASEILDWLRSEGYRIHIITNGFQEIQSLKITNSQIDSYFESITTSECAQSTKPHPEIFESALQKAKAQKNTSMYVGDSLIADVQGALNFGMDAVFYNPHQNENPYADRSHTIHHLTELKEILR